MATATQSTRLTRNQWRERSKALLQNEISFIHTPLFLKLTRVEIDKAPQPLVVDEAVELDPDAARLPTHLSRLFQAPLLTPAGEAHLFRRMNYLKFRANQIRSRIDADKPRTPLVREAEEMLSQAEDARRLIVESNVRLVASVARKFARSTGEFEELLAEGNAILVYAVDKFDFSRGFRFSTYATHALQRHYYRVLQRQQRRRKFEAGCTVEMLSESVPAAPVEEAARDYPRLSAQLIRQMRAQLDERELQIIAERFGWAQASPEKTLKELSGDMGLSKERVRQLQHRALEKLRDFLVEKGITLDEFGA